MPDTIFAKKHTLEQHYQSVSNWWFNSHGSMSPQQQQTVFFVAYERWLNNRPLLEDEDAQASLTVETDPKPGPLGWEVT